MPELAAAAGIGVRTLYRRYGGRDALLARAGCAPPASARDRILHAALDLVGRSGLAELSMDELAARSAVSRATLYRFFPGKAALFDALVQRYSPWEPVAEVLARDPDGDPVDVAPRLAHAIADGLAGRAGLLLRVVGELIGASPDTAAAHRHALDRGLPDLIAYLDRQMTAGRLRRLSPVLACQLLAGPLLAVELTRPLAAALEPPGRSSTDEVDEIAAAWLRALASTDG